MDYKELQKAYIYYKEREDRLGKKEKEYLKELEKKIKEMKK